jgi:uncharacterized membrane protein YhaH (DUF805 family)
VKSKKVGFGEAISRGFQGFVQFRGTASRSEYWYWVLFSVILAVGTTILDGALWPAPAVTGDPLTDIAATFNQPTPLSSLYSLVFLLPSLTVLVRRIRDAGFTAKWLLLWLAPIAYILFAGAAVVTMVVSGSFGSVDDLLAVLFLLLPGIAIAFAVQIVFFVFTLMPTRSFYDGNRYAQPEPMPPLSEGTTA